MGLNAKRGFYMSIDISLAVALTMIILILLTISISNVRASLMPEVAAYKAGESAMYMLKHDGTLDYMAQQLDAHKKGQAQSAAIKALHAYNLPLNMQLTLTTYDANMAAQDSILVRQGSVKEKAFGLSMPVALNGTVSKYGIVNLEVGQ